VDFIQILAKDVTRDEAISGDLFNVPLKVLLLRNIALVFFRVQFGNRREKSNSRSESLHNFLSWFGGFASRLTDAVVWSLEVTIQVGEKGYRRKTNGLRI